MDRLLEWLTQGDGMGLVLPLDVYSVCSVLICSEQVICSWEMGKLGSNLS